MRHCIVSHLEFNKNSIISNYQKIKISFYSTENINSYDPHRTINYFPRIKKKLQKTGLNLMSSWTKCLQNQPCDVIKIK